MQYCYVSEVKILTHINNKTCLVSYQYLQGILVSMEIFTLRIFVESEQNTIILTNHILTNKPSFCSGSCDEIHATKVQKKLHLKILDTPLEIFIKFSWNTLHIFFKHPWNFLKTFMKLPRNSLWTSFRYLEVPLNQP